MRLIDSFDDQKLSLDMTPLIDIIFLLVMFFAVSTSFISGEDLDELKTNLFSASESNKALDAELNITKTQYQTLLAQSEKDNSSMRSLEEKLAAADSSRDEISARLLQAQSEAEQLASKEQLLTQLLTEQQNKNETLASSESEASKEKLELARQLAMMQVLLDDKDAEAAKIQESVNSETASFNEKLNAATAAVEQLNAKLATSQQELNKAQAARDSISANEVLLQKLLAEKTAELNGMIVKLEAAAAERDTALESTAEAERSEQATREQLLSELQSAQTKLISSQAELEKFRNIADADRVQIERAILAQEQLNEAMRGYVENKSLRLTRDQQKLTLHLSDKILFASGSPTIKSGGLEVLRDLGDFLLQKAEELEVQIGGHTDNVPVGGQNGPLADNWGLSAARAVNVVRFFEEELNVEPGRMAAVGYGQYRPVSENETRDGRARNRRIEIVLIPR